MPNSKTDPSARPSGESTGPSRSDADSSNPKELKLELGAVEIGDDGHIRAAREISPSQFTFTACGVTFQAEFQRHPGGLLRLEAELGKLRRVGRSPLVDALVHRLLRTAGQLPGGRITLSDDSDLRLFAEAEPPAPYTPANVIATTAALVIGFKPYLGLVAAAKAL